MFLGSRARPVRRADNLTAISTLDPQHLIPMDLHGLLRGQLSFCFPFHGVRMCRIEDSFVCFVVGVRLGPPLAHCTSPGWWWVWGSRCSDWQGKQKYLEKAWPNASSYTTNPTWPGLGSKPGRRCGSPPELHHSHDGRLWRKLSRVWPSR
jgi:hypothetical protein